MAKYYVRSDGPRPDTRLLIAFLWGDEHDVDTDGDASNPASRTWTDFFCSDRKDPASRFEVELLPDGLGYLAVESETQVLAARVALFLSSEMNTVVVTDIGGESVADEALVDACGDFDIGVAMERAQNSRWRRATLENPYPDP